MIKKIPNLNLMPCLALSAFMLIGTANAGVWSADGASYGKPASENSAEKAIDLTTSVKWVNVTNRETVKFVAGGKAFIWRFETLPEETNFKLSDIAPKDFPARDVRVYVAADPSDRG